MAKSISIEKVGFTTIFCSMVLALGACSDGLVEGGSPQVGSHSVGTVTEAPTEAPAPGGNSDDELQTTPGDEATDEATDNEESSPDIDDTADPDLTNEGDTAEPELSPTPAPDETDVAPTTPVEPDEVEGTTEPEATPDPTTPPDSIDSPDNTEEDTPPTDPELEGEPTPAPDATPEPTPIPDMDGDGFVASEDCDDANAVVNPAAAELCNSVDDNCDGNIDEGLLSLFYGDADGDGFGDEGDSVVACAAPAGFVAVATDCDDSDLSIFPGATETCNGIDDDCDSSVDEDVTSEFFVDVDGDGFGNSDGSTLIACQAPQGYAARGSDCDDSDSKIHPEAAEQCDLADNNCDGIADEGFDQDADGFSSCALPIPDCDDGDAAAFPGAPEVCDGADQNCDGSADEEYLTAEGLAISVSPDAMGDFENGSLEAPFSSIQDGIDATRKGCMRVLVGPGAYLENIDFKGADVKLHSSDGAEVTFIQGQGADSVVKFVSGEGYGAELAGFTLSDGNAATGGGILCMDSAPTIEGNVIVDNRGTYGGGVSLVRCDALLSNNLIEENLAESGDASDGWGGGLYIESGEPVVDGNSILSNRAYAYGGGIAISGSSVALIRGGEIKGNVAGDYLYSRGGGVYSDRSLPVLTGVSIGGNSAKAGGGGVALSGCKDSAQMCTIEDCSLTANTVTDGKGGGLHISDGDSALVTRSVISRNAAAYGAGGVYALFSDLEISNNLVHCNDGGNTGGGIYLDSSYPDILNNTLVENHAAQRGAGLYFYDSESSEKGVNFVNNVVYNNDGHGFYRDGVTTAHSILYNNSYGNQPGNYENIQDPTGSYGNLSITPRFEAYSADCNELNDDYTPLTGGGMVDVGTDVGLDVDLTGISRPRDGDGNGIARVDIGAYER